MADTVFTVPGVAGGEPAGTDAMIAVAPERLFLRMPDGRQALFVNRLGVVLQELSRCGAEAHGKQLLRAEWVVTARPQTVRDRRLPHDCPVCHDGEIKALAYLANNPGRDLLVGTLFWAAR